MAWLQVNKGRLKGSIIHLTPGELILGRDKDVAHIVISDKEIVSRKHAAIVLENDGYSIIDDSRNGTFVNGDKILRNTLIPLKKNDRINICEEEFEAVFFDGAVEGNVEESSSTLEVMISSKTITTWRRSPPPSSPLCWRSRPN